jgi:hypothetical protein
MPDFASQVTVISSFLRLRFNFGFGKKLLSLSIGCLQGALDR